MLRPRERVRRLMGAEHRGGGTVLRHRVTVELVTRPVVILGREPEGVAQTVMPAINRVAPSIPAQDPIPPQPGTTRLVTTGEQQQFRTWLDSLNTGGFAGGGGPTNPDNAYQLRVARLPRARGAACQP